MNQNTTTPKINRSNKQEQKKITYHEVQSEIPENDDQEVPTIATPTSITKKC